MSNPANTIPEKQATNRRLPPVETRFKPGQSGNPNGRPKGQSITAILRRLLDEETGHGKNRKTRAEKLAKALIEYAGRGRGGDAAYAKEVLNRVEGAVPEDGKLTVEIVFVRSGNESPAEN